MALDFRDVPLADVIDAETERTGLGLLLAPGADPGRGARRVTVAAPEPVPFWEAVERIGMAGGARPDFSGNGSFALNRGMGMGNFAGGGGARRPARPITGNEVMLVPDPPRAPAPDGALRAGSSSR